MNSTADAMTAYFELVGGPIVDRQGHSYYGVCRSFSSVGPAVKWEETAAREVWEDYCAAPWGDLGEWDRFFPTLDVARTFQSRFQALGYTFGIIAILPCESAADAAAVEKLPGYLGFDVANTEPSSVLRPEVLWSEVDYANQDPLAVLWALPPKHFRHRVNNWGLLPRFDDAVFLRDTVRALERLDTLQQTPQGVRVLAVREIR